MGSLLWKTGSANEAGRAPDRPTRPPARPPRRARTARLNSKLGSSAPLKFTQPSEPLRVRRSPRGAALARSAPTWPAASRQERPRRSRTLMRIPSMGCATITGLTRPWRGLLVEPSKGAACDLASISVGSQTLSSLARTANRKPPAELSGTISSTSSALGPTSGIGSKTKPATSRSGASPSRRRARSAPPSGCRR